MKQSKEETKSAGVDGICTEEIADEGLVCTYFIIFIYNLIMSLLHRQQLLLAYYFSHLMMP